MIIRPSYPNNTKGRQLLLLVTVLIVVIFLIDLVTGGGVRSIARKIGNTLWDVAHSISLVEFFSTKRSLANENQRLKDELAETQTKLVGLEALRSENEHLRALVRLTDTDRGITAPVISSLQASPYGTFSIGAGTADGIGLGDLVLTADPSFGAFVVGTVAEVAAHQALVEFVFAPRASVDAAINDVMLTLEGRGGGQARGEIPRDAVVQAGDVVIARAVGGRAIGIVGGIEKDLGKASQRIFVHMPVSLSTMRFVYVLPQS